MIGKRFKLSLWTLKLCFNMLLRVILVPYFVCSVKMWNSHMTMYSWQCEQVLQGLTNLENFFPGLILLIRLQNAFDSLARVELLRSFRSAKQDRPADVMPQH